MCELGEVRAKPFCKNPKSGWFVQLLSVRECRKKATGFVDSATAEIWNGQWTQKGRLLTVPGLSVNDPGAGTD